MASYRKCTLILLDQKNMQVNVCIYTLIKANHLSNWWLGFPEYTIHGIMHIFQNQQRHILNFELINLAIIQRYTKVVSYIANKFVHAYFLLYNILPSTSVCSLYHVCRSLGYVTGFIAWPSITSLFLPNKEIPDWYIYYEKASLIVTPEQTQEVSHYT